MERGLMQYLGVLEQRVNELLTQYCALASDGSEDGASVRAAAVLAGRLGVHARLRGAADLASLAPGRPAGVGGGLGVSYPPSTGSLHSSSGEERASASAERPLSRGSLAARAQAAAIRSRGAGVYTTARGVSVSYSGCGGPARV